MLKCYSMQAGRVRAEAVPLTDATRPQWLDLFDPTPEEEKQVQSLLKLEIPTREEMQEIEISSRLYQEDGASFMTAMLLSQADTDSPLLAPVTFVLTPHSLATVRYHDPRVFSAFPARAEKLAIGGDSSAILLIGLFEAVVDRLADVIERLSREINEVSVQTFRKPGEDSEPKDFHQALRGIGLKGDLISNVRESLVSLARLMGFLAHVATTTEEAGPRIKTLSRDIQSLTDHATFLSQKITFLLDATLGMINIEQNAIIKIFSVAAVIFLPPTLVASIYGMNFEFMPELGWHWGYPMAIALMLLSAAIPFWYFKRRKWL